MTCGTLPIIIVQIIYFNDDASYHYNYDTVPHNYHRIIMVMALGCSKTSALCTSGNILTPN